MGEYAELAISESLDNYWDYEDPDDTNTSGHFLPVPNRSYKVPKLQKRSPIAAKLKNKIGESAAKPRKEPLWLGPQSDDKGRGGITQSLIGSFLACRERFRIKTIEGLTTADAFSHRLEYGNLWCAAEEEFKRTNGQGDDWVRGLLEYARKLAVRYPLQGEQIQHWYRVCKTQFPIYHEYWSKHPDTKDRTPIYAEEKFHVPYKLPSGRVVWLRGKWDGVDQLGKNKSAGIWIQEDKTKGDIDPELMKRNLTYDLQTMFYMVALEAMKENYCDDKWADYPLKGIRYNVVRRPLSGGKHTISKHKEKVFKTKTVPAETDEEFYARLGELIAGDPEFFFMRWTVEIFPGEIEKFRRECLDPILEQICVWYDVVTTFDDPFEGMGGIHFRFPYGVYNPMSEGKPSELDEYLKSGSKIGLVDNNDLFPELRV